MDRMRVAQVGTRHGHAAGKLRAMLDSSEVEVVGVYEPDKEQRAAVASAVPWNGIEWFESMEGTPRRRQHRAGRLRRSQHRELGPNRGLG